MEVTASQAAQKYGVFPHVLYRMILMGRIEARKDADGHWLISKESLDRWDRRRVRRAPKPEHAAIAVGVGA
jgi:Helix-turn-helix domain